MRFPDFKKEFNNYPLFSVREVEKLYPNWNKMNLRNWQKKNYILKLRNNWYTFTDREINEYFLFYAANKIYSPSYISLESALNYYGLIPEVSFSISSVTTLKTERFSNGLGNFMYSNIKKGFYFGYELVEHNDLTIRIASREKALLDYLYLRKDIKNADDIISLRINSLIFTETIDVKKLLDYTGLCNSKVLTKKVKLLLDIFNA
jgi:predicted transcriptional regulator of viral defense system